jgi:hypothetical protein
MALLWTDKRRSERALLAEAADAAGVPARREPA